MPHTREIQPPLVYGNEEETGLLIDKGGRAGFDEPYELTKNIKDYIPQTIRITNGFMSNGGKIYGGGTGDEKVKGLTNIERATPECASPSELTAYIRSHEELVLQAVTNYITATSTKTGNDVHGRIQRRVVDAKGTRKGCHDNFSTEGLQGAVDLRHGSAVLNDAVLGHLATRSFVTGAGYINPKGHVAYAQKVGGLSKTRGYAFRGSMYRHDSTDGDRLEVRCSDVNISDWATRMRIGSTALAMMVANTSLQHELPTLDPHNDMYRRAQSYNSLMLNPDGSLQPDRDMRNALSYQRQLADISLDELQKYTEGLDEDLTWTAEELLNYCIDFQHVLDGDAHIGTLADRADWAAKLDTILSDYQERAPHDKSASICDIRAQYLDLKYDHIGLGASGGKAKRPQFGYGYKLRDKGHFRYTAPHRVVERGVHKPPKNTRAHERGRIIRNYPADSASWKRVHYMDNGAFQTTHFPDLRTDR